MKISTYRQSSLYLLIYLGTHCMPHNSSRNIVELDLFTNFLLNLSIMISNGTFFKCRLRFVMNKIFRKLSIKKREDEKNFDNSILKHIFYIQGKKRGSMKIKQTQIFDSLLLFFCSANYHEELLWEQGKSMKNLAVASTIRYFHRFVRTRSMVWILSLSFNFIR